jgi:hypothetical protein
LRKVTVEGVTSSIDPDIQPENIKQGVDILGVEGTLKPPVLIQKQITANGPYAAEDDNVDGYSEVEVAVPQAITKLVDGTITEYIDDEVVSVRDYAFAYCAQIERVSMANAAEIGERAFGYCGTITELNIPNVSIIKGTVFFFTPLIHPLGKPFVFPNVLNITGIETFGRYSQRPPHDVGFYFPKLVSMGNDSWRNRIAKVILKRQCELIAYASTSFIYTTYYVPQRYFNWYTTATNWAAGYAAYPNSIQTIEDNIDYLVSLGFSREELLREEEA